MKRSRFFGPSAMVTAAFIGPGTLTVCTLAGVNFGYDLLWVLLFAVLATVILQSMASRLGIVTKSGLGEAIRSQIRNKILRIISLGLVFSAIIIGNAAYEMGNITGGILGLENEEVDHLFWGPLILGAIVAGLLWTENYERIQFIMGLLILVMSFVFVTSAIIVGSLDCALTGINPSLNTENQLTALGLIGTTVVPYNLFLHTSTSAKHWQGVENLGTANREIFITISLGGIISMSVLITAASSNGTMVQSITDISRQLEPLLGSFAKTFISVGIFAAGLSSALTAPLAASLTAQGIFGWKENWKKKVVWGSVLLVGVLLSMIGMKPIIVIHFAQIANGILLPVVVFFLIVMSNNSALMGRYTNTKLQNILGTGVLLVSLLISVRSFNSVFQFL